MLKKLLLLFILELLFHITLFSQIDNNQDLSLLENKFKKASNINEKIKIYLNLFLLYEYSDTVKARKINDYCIINSKRINNQFYLAQAYNHKGFLYEDQGNLNFAKLMYEKVLLIGKKINNYKLISNASNNIGIINKIQGDLSAALKMYHSCLNIELKSKDSNSIAGTYVNLGEIYRAQKDFDKALIYFNKAKLIWLNSNKYYEKAVVFNNIGLVLTSQNKKKSARIALQNSYINYKKAKMKAGMATSLMNIGLTFNQFNFPDSSLYYSKLALGFANQTSDSLTIMNAIKDVASAYFNVKNYSKSIEYNLISYQYYKSNNLIDNLRENCYNLSKTYNKIGDDKNAYKMLKEHISINNKFLDSEKTKQLVSMESKFQSVQKDKLLAENKSEIMRKKNQQILLFAGLLLVLISSFFIYNRFRLTKKQNVIIEQQKHLVEEKNKEITDSITYAKRIQSAILPQPKLVKEFLEDSFIIYKPKDIVAGDFYWLEVVGDTVLFAAADCTGHGVPGAMVSVVCNNGLNRAVREFGLTSPNEILDKTRELVIEEFEKSEEDVKDGMDISLCALDTNLNVLKWAGANNPLWILRNKEIIEYKADKQPIGKYANTKPFSLVEFQLEKDDIIYIFTDGFQDQFGGPKEKKFRAAQMRELFLSLTSKTMEEQRKVIDETFENWKRELEQVDDVCIIGVRI